MRRNGDGGTPRSVLALEAIRRTGRSCSGERSLRAGRLSAGNRLRSQREDALRSRRQHVRQRCGAAAQAFAARRWLDVAPARRRRRRRSRACSGAPGSARSRSRQIFNVLEENYQIRQLAMLVAGSLGLLNPPIRVELEQAPLPSPVRNYRMSNAKLTRVLGFTPSRTVLESVEDMLGRLPCKIRSASRRSVLQYSLDAPARNRARRTTRLRDDLLDRIGRRRDT